MRVKVDVSMFHCWLMYGWPGGAPCLGGRSNKCLLIPGGAAASVLFD